VLHGKGSSQRRLDLNTKMAHPDGSVNFWALNAVPLQGGSMVNRIIPYLGRMPHVLHRLDMFTSGEHKTLLPHRTASGPHQQSSANMKMRKW
jgi:hypothetical protein